MEPVCTRKLNRGVVYVFGNITQEMMLLYLVFWVVMAWFSRAWIGNALMQYAAPLPIIALVVHPIGVFLQDAALGQRAMLALRFAFKADRYVLKPDPMPLPHVIPAHAQRRRH